MHDIYQNELTTYQHVQGIPLYLSANYVQNVHGLQPFFPC